MENICTLTIKINHPLQKNGKPLEARNFPLEDFKSKLKNNFNKLHQGTQGYENLEFEDLFTDIKCIKGSIIFIFHIKMIHFRKVLKILRKLLWLAFFSSLGVMPFENKPINSNEPLLTIKVEELKIYVQSQGNINKITRENLQEILEDLINEIIKKIPNNFIEETSIEENPTRQDDGPLR